MNPTLARMLKIAGAFCWIAQAVAHSFGIPADLVWLGAGLFALGMAVG